MEGIDLDKKNWNVPPEHRKTGFITGEVRTVAISKPMLAVLDEMQRRRTDPSPDALVFPSPSTGREYSVSTIARHIRLALKWPLKLDAHGFRTTLTGWAKANRYPEVLVDEQLDHLPEGKVKQAYDEEVLEQRREMMEAWVAIAIGSNPSPSLTSRSPTMSSASLGAGRKGDCHERTPSRLDQ